MMQITDSSRIGDIDHDNSADHIQQQQHHDVRKLGNLGHGKQLVKTKALLQETAQETILQPATSTIPFMDRLFELLLQCLEKQNI
jgi:hypothetical protein